MLAPIMVWVDAAGCGDRVSDVAVETGGGREDKQRPEKAPGGATVLGRDLGLGQSAHRRPSVSSYAMVFGPTDTTRLASTPRAFRYALKVDRSMSLCLSMRLICPWLVARASASCTWVTPAVRRSSARSITEPILL